MKPRPATMTLDDFQLYVAEALETLPEDIKEMMANVAVTVAEHPTAAQRQAVGLGPGRALYGLYQGVPLTARTTNYGMVAPDRITLFMYPMVQHFASPDALRRQIRRTVMHEIGHHFGLGEKQLRDLGY